MDDTLLVDVLESANVIESTGSIELTDAFQQRVRTIDAPVTEDDVERTLSTIADDDHVEVLRSLVETDPTFCHHYLAVREFSPELTHNEAIQAALVVGFIEEEFPRTDGVPAGFFPVRGEQLETVLRLYSRAVVYIWLADCEPCDRMRANFEEAFDDGHEDVARFAVFGPNCAAILDETYDVPGGPATLFMLNGRVDARLYGVRAPGVIRSEIEKLRELDR